MIPKIIHYCWFGQADIPQKLKKCIQSWNVMMPEYEIIRWDESNFDINSTEWTRQAYEKGKYAFVSDYVRLKALYEYGGIYFDTDVMVKKTFNPLLQYRAFTGFENKLYLTSAVIGCEKHFPLIAEFIESYCGKKFIDDNGTIDDTANVVMMTEICKKYGLRIDDSEQEIQGLHIFPKEVFCPIDFYHNKHITDRTMAIHYFDASWLDEETKRMVVKERTLRHKMFVAVKSALAKVIKYGSK